MPLQPYNQPSGPQLRLLKTLCLHSRLQPSSSTSGGPSGLSSPSRSGTKIRFGVLHSQTPPKPSAMPLRLTPLSRKTVFLSNRPSPSVSSRMVTRSSPLPSLLHFGYDRHSTTQSRPRSSVVMAMG